MTYVSNYRVPSREDQKRLTRLRLYQAALSTFRRDGVEATRIDDIAKVAGVSRGTFYFHFPTKEHVLLERMRETEAQICAAIEALPEGASIDEVIACLLDQLAEIWENDPRFLPDVAAAALRHTATTMHDRASTPLRALLARRFRLAAERNELGAFLPPDVISDLYLGHTLAALLAWYGNPTLSLRALLEAVTTLFWNGAKAPSYE